MVKHSNTSSKRPLRIGISACFFHADPQRAIFKGKTLMYVEQSIAHWVMSAGDVLAFMIPAPSPHSSIQLSHYADDLDGLLLEGGSDLSPQSYGETPLRPEWSGDAIRDAYEIALFREFLARKKPILGICRGAQLINVALGGTLYQDIETQVEGAPVHRNWQIYDQLFHTIDIEAGSRLAELYPETPRGRVNSIHHQGIKKLGQGLVVEARSEAGLGSMIEAVRLRETGSPSDPCYVSAVQWHPEFHSTEDLKNQDLLSPQPLLQDFLEAVARRKNQN
jgi:putative glutamine amidotransferase